MAFDRRIGYVICIDQDGHTSDVACILSGESITYQAERDWGFGPVRP